MIPKALYETLPALYILCGLAVLFNLDHTLGTMSGLILVTLSMMVSIMRYNYRRAA